MHFARGVCYYTYDSKGNLRHRRGLGLRDAALTAPGRDVPGARSHGAPDGAAQHR
jgi:hypothetical protein